jgi:hypothetical protein
LGSTELKPLRASNPPPRLLQGRRPPPRLLRPLPAFCQSLSSHVLCGPYSTYFFALSGESNSLQAAAIVQSTGFFANFRLYFIRIGQWNILFWGCFSVTLSMREWRRVTPCRDHQDRRLGVVRPPRAPSTIRGPPAGPTPPSPGPPASLPRRRRRTSLPTHFPTCSTSYRSRSASSSDGAVWWPSS